MPNQFPNLARDFTIATGNDVRSWSFGAVSRRRDGSPITDWKSQIGTLNDPRTFGAVHDFECACRKYVGQRYADIICDECGVKVTSTSVRAVRFGHINLPEPIAHPFARSSETLKALPVLPAHTRESPAGLGLDELYEAIVDAVAAKDSAAATALFGEICRKLLPAMSLASDWSIGHAKTIFAHGMALIPIDEADEWPTNLESL